MKGVAHSPNGPSSPGAPPPAQTNSQSPSASKPKAQPSTNPNAAKSTQQNAASRLNDQKIQSSVREAQLRSSKGANLDVDGQGHVSRDYEPKRSIDVAQDPGFNKLPGATREKLMQEIRKDPIAHTKLQRVLNHSEYSKLSPEQKSKLLNVFSEAGPKSRDALLPLMDRKLKTSAGEKLALLSTDNTKEKATLLDHLNHTATQNLAPELKGRRKELLSGIIQETGRPSYHVDQGRTNHCGSASVEAHLLLNSPAEYARIINGLSSPKKSLTLANGSTMYAAKNQENMSTPSGKEYRSLTNRMIQSAIHQHGKRRPENAFGLGKDHKGDANTSGSFGGLDMAHVMSAMYAPRKFEAFPTNAQASSSVGYAQYPEKTREILFERIKEQFKSKNGPIIVGMNWGDEKTTKLEHGHVVMIHHIDEQNGRVYFFNPQNGKIRRPQSLPYENGKEITDPARPDRRVEIAENKLESLPIADFKKLIESGVFPAP